MALTLLDNTFQVVTKSATVGFKGRIHERIHEFPSSNRRAKPSGPSKFGRGQGHPCLTFDLRMGAVRHFERVGPRSGIFNS